MIKNFPKFHILAVGGLSSALAITLLLSPSADVEANRTSVPLIIDTPAIDQALELTVEDNEPYITDATALHDLTSQETIAVTTPIETTENWQHFEVKKGDTLSAIFSRAGFSASQLYKVLGDAKENKALANVYPGQKIAFVVNEQNQISKIKHTRSRLEHLLITRDDNGSYHSQEVHIAPDVHLAYAEGTIEDSLFLAAQSAGLPGALIMELATIFGWDIDFILDIRTGDQFKLTYEELFVDGEKIGHGKILAARFVNQGKTYEAVLYKDRKGIENYFTPGGDSMRKAFLRTPVDFARISSHFNLRRKHPVLHTIRAHKGTDYAASRGTPIKVSGDGKVVFAGRKGGYGKVVIVQHGQNIKTLYAHLHNYGRGIKSGQRVRQGQVIGYVGSTGLASGPHLHYEFLVNGVHKNPLTVKLPQAKAIASGERAKFDEISNIAMSQLNTLADSYQVASNP